MACGAARFAFILLLFCHSAGIMAIGPDLPTLQFNDTFQVSWGNDHVQLLDGGDSIELSLDATSGSGFLSTIQYTYGYFSVNLKLVPGNSAGTVTAFYLFSVGDQHDEVDYEFLGNSTGEPYILQSNIFANGTGEREQRIYLWFDPTTDFHTYAILWNHEQIVLLVDDHPIRVFKNLESQGVDYPSWRPMGVYSSIFDASSWATRGGAVPIDYSASPFVVTYSQFKIAACPNINGTVQDCATNYTSNWWESSDLTALNATQQADLLRIRQSYLVYDYCTDVPRNPVPPVECSYNIFQQ